MSLKKLRYIVDSTGNYLKVPVKGIVAQEDKASSIQLISPMKGSVAVSFTIYDSTNKTMVQYLAPQDLRAQDVLDESDPYFQVTYDWYVYEIEIRHRFITQISRAHSGRVGVSFTFRHALENAPEATEYIGTFGRNRIPETAEDGQFIVCEYYNFDWNNETLTKGDILYWLNDKWNISYKFIPVLNTQTINIPIDPSVYAYIPDEDLDQGELEELWLSIGNIQDKVFEVLDSGTRIHLTGEQLNKESLTTLNKSDLEISDRVVVGDIVISQSIKSNGYVGVVKFTTATEAVIEYKFILAGSGSGINIVFNTEEDLKDWLDGDYQREDNLAPEDLFIGQLIFLRQTDVPDYWVSRLPVNNINDLDIQESDQTFDRTAIGETEPGDKFDIWIDTTYYENQSEDFGIMSMGFDPNYEYTQDPGQVEQIEEEEVVDIGDIEQIEEEQVHDVGSDTGIELPGGASEA